MVVRTGRGWVMGPDAKGRAAIRVDGLSAAWAVRRTSPVDKPEEPPGDEPIATILLRPHSGVRSPILAALVVLIPAVIMTVNTATGQWDLVGVTGRRSTSSPTCALDRRRRGRLPGLPDHGARHPQPPNVITFSGVMRTITRDAPGGSAGGSSRAYLCDS